MKVFELILKFGMIKELELRKKMGSNIEMRERDDINPYSNGY